MEVSPIFKSSFKAEDILAHERVTEQLVRSSVQNARRVKEYLSSRFIGYNREPFNKAHKAHNSIFKCDIISLCETSSNEAAKVPDNILKGYHVFSSDHISGDKKGGVGIFYKESLPLKIRHDLSFNVCIVIGLIFGRKKIFFYRFI